MRFIWLRLNKTNIIAWFFAALFCIVIWFGIVKIVEMARFAAGMGRAEVGVASVEPSAPTLIPSAQRRSVGATVFGEPSRCCCASARATSRASYLLSVKTASRQKQAVFDARGETVASRIADRFTVAQLPDVRRRARDEVNTLAAQLEALAESQVGQGETEIDRAVRVFFHVTSDAPPFWGAWVKISVEQNGQSMPPIFVSGAVITEPTEYEMKEQ